MLNASVIIPTHNRPDALVRCLSPLVQTQRDHGQPREIIVVDDGSAPEQSRRAAALIKTFDAPNLQLVYQTPNQGVSAARNRGVLCAKGDLLVFLDDDLIPSPTMVQDYVALHQQHPEILILCGHLFTRDRSVYGRLWARCYDHVFGRPGQGRDLFPIRMLSGGHVAFKRAVLDQVHPLFDPSLPSREDFDTYLRAKQAGIPVFKTAYAAAEIVPRTNFPAFIKQREWYAKGEHALRAKHGVEPLRAAATEGRPDLTLDMRLLTYLARLWITGRASFRRRRTSERSGA